MITGGVIHIAIRLMIHIADNVLMFSYFIDMAVKRPYRPVSSGTDDEPNHKKAFQHSGRIHYYQSNLLELRQITHFLYI